MKPGRLSSIPVAIIVGVVAGAGLFLVHTKTLIEFFVPGQDLGFEWRRISSIRNKSVILLTAREAPLLTCKLQLLVSVTDPELDRFAANFRHSAVSLASDQHDPEGSISLRADRDGSSYHISIPNELLAFLTWPSGLMIELDHDSPGANVLYWALHPKDGPPDTSIKAKRRKVFYFSYIIVFGLALVGATVTAGKSAYDKRRGRNVPKDPPPAAALIQIFPSLIVGSDEDRDCVRRFLEATVQGRGLPESLEVLDVLEPRRRQALVFEATRQLRLLAREVDDPPTIDLVPDAAKPGDG